MGIFILKIFFDFFIQSGSQIIKKLIFLLLICLNALRIISLLMPDGSPMVIAMGKFLLSVFNDSISS